MNCRILFVCSFILVLGFPSSNTYEKNFFPGVNRFSAKFFETLAERSEKNVIISPISALTVLSMAICGADGFTRRESMNALQLPIDQSGLLDFKNFILSLQNFRKVELQLANKIFVQNEFPIHRTFSNITETVFQSKIENVDFRNVYKAAARINNWCQKETRDKIKNIMKPDDLEDAELVIVNAVYFKGKWAEPFESELIDRPFQLSENTSVIVPMMCKTVSNFERIPSDDAIYVELPYETDKHINRLSMFIFYPLGKTNLDDIVHKLHEIDFTQLENPEEETNFCMPKFKIESERQIIPTLRAMGFQDMFEDSANFSNLSPRGNLKISKVIQKAFLSVDEKGSEAGAATGAGFSDRMASNIIINRPFLAAIVKKDSGTPLFWARINDPRN